MERAGALEEVTSVTVLSFEEFFQAEHVRLARALYLLTGSAAEADELTQEAMVRVYALRTASRGRRPMPFRSPAVVRRPSAGSGTWRLDSIGLCSLATPYKDDPASSKRNAPPFLKVACDRPIFGHSSAVAQCRSGYPLSLSVNRRP